MRIIAGKYRSRQIKSLKGRALRPTSDRLRETLFNVLSPFLADARFLDVFAGTGATGIEALSRGASEAVFLESHAAAVRLIRENLAALGIRSGFRILAGDAAGNLEKLAAECKATGDAFDIAFLDPPYAAARQYERVLQSLGASSLLASSGIVVAEHSRKVHFPENVGSLHRYRVLQQGDTSLSFYRRGESTAAESDA